MPEMDGLEATKRIRALERASIRRIPIIALTANAMNEHREACLNIGMDDYVAKPVQIEVLSRTIARWLSVARTGRCLDEPDSADDPADSPLTTGSRPEAP